MQNIMVLYYIGPDMPQCLPEPQKSDSPLCFQEADYIHKHPNIVRYIYNISVFTIIYIYLYVTIIALLLLTILLWLSFVEYL